MSDNDPTVTPELTPAQLEINDEMMRGDLAPGVEHLPADGWRNAIREIERLRAKVEQYRSACTNAAAEMRTALKRYDEGAD